MPRYYFLNLLTLTPDAQTVAELHNPSELTGMISFAEVCKTLSSGKAVLADAVLNKVYNDLYKLDPNPCLPSRPLSIHCLHLYLYALDTWEDGVPNFLSEDQLSALLVLTQQISKSCCCE